MRIPVQQRRIGLKFDITPLIDIVFNLVIFFLVATHFVSSEARESIALPGATQTDDRPPLPRRLIVTIRADDSLVVNGRTLTADDIDALIAADASSGVDDYEVQIRGDRDADFAAVEPVLLSCARHGVTRIDVSKVDR